MQTAAAGGPTPREVTVSKNSCDFQSGQYLLNGIGRADNCINLAHTVNNPTGHTALGAQFNLQSGDVVFLNVRNRDDGGPSCMWPACDILFDFGTPNRY